jgi:hypothetical protein
MLISGPAKPIEHMIVVRSVKQAVCRQFLARDRDATRADQHKLLPATARSLWQELELHLVS